MKQPMKSYTVTTTLSKHINYKWIMIWMKETMSIEWEVDLQDSVAEHMAKSALVLINTLMQGCSIPVFSEGILEEIDTEGDKIICKIKIAYVDMIFQSHYTNIINASFDAIRLMGHNQMNTSNKDEIRMKLYNDTVLPILKTMPPGKSTMHVLKQAYTNNIPFIHLGDGVYQLGWGSKGVKVDRSTVEYDSALGSKMSQNKITAANLIKMAGLPSPVHGVARTLEDAIKIASTITYPVVIKPIDLDRGEGVSIDITDDTMLSKAFDEAYKLSRSKRVIVEKQVSGVCYRIFVINQTLLYAVRRSPISIQGDGQNTIETLIRNANQKESLKTPWDKSKEFFPFDGMAIESIAKEEMNMTSIPPKGRWIPLRDKESTQWGGKIDEVTSIIHPDNVEIAIRAAALFNLHVAGVDIITSDISKPWYETGAIINEVNFAPMLGGHSISRGYISAYLAHLIENDGRIPVKVFIGNDGAWEKAKEYQNNSMLKQINCYATSRNLTLKPDGTKIHFNTTFLEQRFKALIMDRSVDELIVVVASKEDCFIEPYVDESAIAFNEYETKQE